MIDFHTHILPDIDDGAADRSQSISIMNELVEQGITTALLTPHFYPGEQTVDNFLQKRGAAFDLIAKDIPKNLKTVLGAELHFNGKRTHYREYARLKIEGTSYILIELPYSHKWDKNLFSALSDFIDATKLTPVIAHAERYPAVRMRPSLVYKLITMGCLIQLNANSLFDKRLRALATRLILGKQVHCLGSDAHNLSSRKPLYSDAVNLISAKFGGEEVERLQQTMKDILEDKDIEIEITKPVKRLLAFYL